MCSATDDLPKPDATRDVAAQEDLLEVARGAVNLSGCIPLQPMAVPKTVAFYLLCPHALVEEARLFLQVLHPNEPHTWLLL